MRALPEASRLSACLVGVCNAAEAAAQMAELVAEGKEKDESERCCKRLTSPIACLSIYLRCLWLNFASNSNWQRTIDIHLELCLD